MLQHCGSYAVLRGGRTQNRVWGLITPSKTWHSLTSAQWSWANHASSEGMNTFRPVCECSKNIPWGRGVLQQSQLGKGGHWHDGKYYLTSTVSASYHSPPLSGSNPSLFQNKGWFVMVILWWSPPLHLVCSLAHCQQSTCWFCKWLIELLTIIISVSQPHNRLLPACAQFFLQKLGAALSRVPK